METGSYLLDTLNTVPWCISLPKLQQIQEVLKLKYFDNINYEDVKRSHDSFMASALSRKVDPEKGYEITNGKAIIPVHGTLLRKAGWLDAMSGAQSLGQIEDNIRSALSDRAVSHIILDVDSPGGHDPYAVAEMVYKGREEKRITTLVTGQMGSAATWIGSASDEVYSVSPAAWVGSIGVYLAHTQMDSEYKVTYIQAGKYKTVGRADAPLSEEDKEYLQDLVDKQYSIFIESVAKYRGVSNEKVLEEWADGKLFSANDAVELGLIDGVASIDEILNI